MSSIAANRGNQAVKPNFENGIAKARIVQASVGTSLIPVQAAGKAVPKATPKAVGAAATPKRPALTMAKSDSQTKITPAKKGSVRPAPKRGLLSKSNVYAQPEETLVFSLSPEAQQRAQKQDQIEEGLFKLKHRKPAVEKAPGLPKPSAISGDFIGDSDFPFIEDVLSPEEEIEQRFAKVEARNAELETKTAEQGREIGELRGQIAELRWAIAQNQAPQPELSKSNSSVVLSSAPIPGLGAAETGV